MGFFKRESAASASPAALEQSELAQDALVAAWECMHRNRDTGTFTRGRGSAHQIKVAGTQHRSEIITHIATRYRTQYPEDPVAAAIVLRDPANEFDRNAIRVLIDGIHVGFLPKDEAKRWQPVLLECEKRGVTLVGMARFIGEDGWGLRLQLRDNLKDYEGPITKAERERAEMVSGDGVAILLDEENFRRVSAVLAVDDGKVPSNRQKAGLRAKHVRDTLRDVYAHAAAIKANGDEATAQELLDLCDELENSCEDLIEADDHDDREDAVDAMASTAEELLEAVAETIGIRKRSPGADDASTDASVPLPPATWAKDPSGRHELRYWDGAQWTEHVSNSGVQGIDAIPTAR